MCVLIPLYKELKRLGTQNGIPLYIDPKTWCIQRGERLMQIKNFDILDKGQKAYCVRTQTVFILKDDKLYSKYILCGLCTHTIRLNQMF